MSEEIKKEEVKIPEQPLAAEDKLIMPNEICGVCALPYFKHAAEDFGHFKTKEECEGGVCKQPGVVPEKVLCGRCKKEKKNKDQNGTQPVDPCKCGRPLEYTEELLVKAREYEAAKMPFTGEDGIQELVHSIAGLAVHIGISRETVRVWAKDAEKAEFSAIVEKILAKQEKTLVKGGLSEEFSGSISKLMLTKHGYRDQVDNFNRDVPVDPAAKAMSDAAVDEFLKNNKVEPKK